MMDDKVLLPRKLTAENGAKALLMGEFFENRECECPECFGTVGFSPDVRPCGTCDGSGRFVEQTPVSWTTIKSIYEMIVKNFENKEIAR